MSPRPDPHYNPLDTRNLAQNIADVLMERPVEPLPPDQAFDGAGIHAIHYTGDFDSYSVTASVNRQEPGYTIPIYVGKAVPKGGRSGGYAIGARPGNVLFDRLSEHAESIGQSTNLDVDHFRCRYLILEQVWIPLGESLLIQQHAPLWNQVIQGFGNHDPGGGRYKQKCSAWDAMHPGRPWVQRCMPHDRSIEDLKAKIDRSLRKRVMGNTAE